MDAVNEISPLVSQVIPSHGAKSHDFFDAHGGIYSVNVSISSHALFFLPDKNVSYLNVRISFLCAILEFMRILVLPSSVFFMRYSKMRIKIGGWKRSYW